VVSEQLTEPRGDMVIEGTAVEVSSVADLGDEIRGEPVDGWEGDLPVFLIFEPANGEGGNIGIDLDAPGWIEGNRETFRRPGVWFLVDKGKGAVMCMPTAEGDQFFYHRHHVGVIASDSTSQVTAHVIGKKQDDGSTVRLWLMPNGMVMTGDEDVVDPVASRML
jgi:hypothetical protein